MPLLLNPGECIQGRLLDLRGRKDTTAVVGGVSGPSSPARAGGQGTKLTRNFDVVPFSFF